MKKHALAAALGMTMLAGGAGVAAAQTSQATSSNDVNVASGSPPRGMRGGGLMRADANGDGVVTRDEVIADADRRFATMDTDGDGKLSGDESRAARPHRRVYGERGEQAPSDPSGNRFSNSDRARPPMTREAFRDRALRMFDRADTNHDGRVDAREMEAMRLLRRARMADGDQSRATPPSDEQQ